MSTAVSSSSVDVTLRGHRLRLLAVGGVYHRDQGFLLVADLHLGKDTTFRKYGLAVPRGAASATIAKVERLIEATDPEQVFFLGDMFHAKSAVSDDLHQQIVAFRDRHRRLAMTLVRGNHDASFRNLPDVWAIESVGEGFTIGNVRLCHHPIESSAAEGLAFAGHVHPSFSMQSATERLGRLPCFWYSRGCLVLPALGEFTGTHSVRHDRDEDRVWIAADETVLEVPYRSAAKISRPG
ncbi:ligase-associated DNA damage response endonuclease PdeM [Roseiconus lacunae]|uniref:Ligase-associated DNA damage response endonuclease PdeM n=1 Tax=Roseiconus lacunae TaxID=2605694 RepID=A0ABT7PNB5_9BACT|nr:ligase-associated DNA damage response endonuclease PdeM [Roseiconus lacunae]MDM4017976.1 ligase-associated DNA damage response endonuclease PdeM [Roseiconus lacunae]